MIKLPMLGLLRSTSGFFKFQYFLSDINVSKPMFPFSVQGFVFNAKFLFTAAVLTPNIETRKSTSRTNSRDSLLFLSVRQYADICLFSTAQYKCPVAVVEAE